MCAFGDRLELLEALDVALERLAARAGAAGRDGVGGLHEDGLDGRGLDVAVVRLDAVHDRLRLVHAPREVGADDRVRTLDLVVDRLAEVVEQAGALRELDVDAELGGHDAGEVADLERVLEHVLAVAGAVLQAAEGADELRVQPVDSAVEGRLLAGLVDGLADELLGLVEHLLDAGRVDAPVGDAASRA